MASRKSVNCEQNKTPFARQRHQRTQILCEAKGAQRTTRRWPKQSAHRKTQETKQQNTKIKGRTGCRLSHSRKLLKEYWFSLLLADKTRRGMPINRAHLYGHITNAFPSARRRPAWRRVSNNERCFPRLASLNAGTTARSSSDNAVFFELMNNSRMPTRASLTCGKAP